MIKLKQPGDVLVSTPVIAALKEAWPHCHLTYLVPKGTEEMVAGHPLLDDLLVVDRRNATWVQTLSFIRDLRRRRFDLVIELSGGDRGALYSWLSGARERVGFEHPRMPFWQRRGCFTQLLPRPAVKMHLVDQNLEPLRALGLNPQKPRLQFFWDQEVEKRTEELLASLGLTSGAFAVMHPGAGWRFKCWTPQGYARVLEALQNDWRLPVVLTGTKAAHEQELLADILKESRVTPINLAGRLTLKELGALIDQGPLVFRHGQRPHAPGRGGGHPGGGPLRPQRRLQLGSLGRGPPGAPEGLGVRPLRPGRL